MVCHVGSGWSDVALIKVNNKNAVLQVQTQCPLKEDCGLFQKGVFVVAAAGVELWVILTLYHPPLLQGF